MSMVSPRRGVRRAVGWATGLLAVCLLLGLGARAARAASCDTSWKSAVSGSWNDAANWSGGVPTAGSNACIVLPGTYTVTIAGQTAAAQSIQLGGGSGSGIQTLAIQGTNDGSAHAAELDLTNGGLIGATGQLLLTSACSLAGCTTGASASLTDLGSTPLDNQGMIVSDPGSDAGSAGRAISANLTNQGAIQVNTTLRYAAGTLGNQGTISLAGGQTLSLPCCQKPSLTNGAGGLITNGGSTGHVDVQAEATFSQATGITSPATASAADPAVIMDNGAFAPAPTLSYTGNGASTIEAVGGVNLSGNISPGQNLLINGVAGCPSEGAVVTAASGFVNAGTITLAGTCDSSLRLSSGTLMNTGTLTAAPTPTNITREIAGSLSNAGTLVINGATAFDGAGATLSQTGGTTTIGPQVIFDTSGSGATFELQGGVLTGGGQTQATQAFLNGALDNVAGNVIPGSPSSPGLMTLGGAYTQEANGTLTEVIAGSTRGTGYSELAAVGNITLSGTLAITTQAHPSVGDLDTVLATNGSLSGTFSSVQGAFSPTWSFGYRPAYGSNYAALSVGAALHVKKGGPGSGTVTSSPSGINCGGACNAPFFQSQTVTLTAQPATGWAFNGWSGACTGYNLTCQVQMSQARTVTAMFARPTATKLTSSANPSKVGRAVTYTATVSPRPGGGTVRFTSGGSQIPGCGAVTVSASTGKATCSVRYGSGGLRRIRAVYSGTSAFARSSSGILKQTVR